MPIESWTAPEETSEMAAHAAAMIDAALVGSGLTRDAYWDAVRKGYNTPYNDPPRKRPAAAQPNALTPSSLVAATVEPACEPLPLPVAAMAAVTAETRAV